MGGVRARFKTFSPSEAFFQTAGVSGTRCLCARGWRVVDDRGGALRSELDYMENVPHVSHTTCFSQIQKCTNNRSSLNAAITSPLQPWELVWP
jgi:hypothetical protein